ncbi:hypothetical protein [Halalkalicoccus jeotgali]|uniref:Uncharacterized protein n=1 Tax=Halalkalicoccus jeotgali (strain DSM 18796 / CECT 7217 / JCM 14584 / KCTC 4019 / B3) TaxID=795797 RepID=D8JAE0_HALJB|nr:hypothetical protein [Halalkalicoccus jeotgali]ADJ14662.1 hypothetical protein HacjB3_06355 [Halalkalicoccus jeotgali B3]ELY39560.1 hypothetical protein C497_04752 [Halalkalicoccus jeotgali B3]
MSDSDDLVPPADTMRERTDESTLKIWFLVTANRWLVTGLLSLSMVAIFVGLYFLGPTNLPGVMGASSVGNVFGSVIIAVVTGVSLILAIAQLVLSEQMGPLGEKQAEMRDQIEFRGEVEDRIDAAVGPATPSAFLSALIEAVDRQARALRESVADDDVTELYEYADSLLEHGEEVSDQLESTEFGSFEVILPVLNYNYSWKIVAGRTLAARYADSIGDDTERHLEKLIESLRFFAPAREYFKMLYFQWEINNIARGVLYASIPSLAIAAYMILAFDATLITGSTLGLPNRYLAVGLLYSLALLPFTVVLAYILRIVTVTKRTLALGPFILRETKQAGDVN